VHVWRYGVLCHSSSPTLKNQDIKNEADEMLGQYCLFCKSFYTAFYETFVNESHTKYFKLKKLGVCVHKEQMHVLSEVSF